MIGKTLAHYEISSQIGKGGMGEVYKAKDQKLGRDVAIKVLPEEFAKDADRVGRFQREAKLLASLNHPNIASIYGLEEADGAHFLVLELIEGDTLADRIKGGPVPVEEALKLALQIAEALEAAHEKGVIHRDLKPANIKVTPDNKIKVLDFGLAKAFAGDSENMNLSNSPTLSVAATQQGVILGTAAYMSPEQASGETTDKRADIWAFGVVLYEMLTGRSLFGGNSVSQTLARVLEREPDFAALPPNLHFRIRFLLERCLKKEPKDRCSGISDARVDIQQVLADPSGIYAQTITTIKPRKKLRVGMPWVAAALVLMGIIVGVAVWYLKPSEPRQIVSFEHSLPEDQDLGDPSYRAIAVSPDGTQFVYCASGGLYLRKMGDLDARLIAGTADEQPIFPFFSPDDKWIGYSSRKDGQLKKITISGGAPVKICNAPMLSGASWGEDNTIVYCELLEGVKRVSANGGTPEILGGEPSGFYGFPQILPNGKSVLFMKYAQQETLVGHIMVLSLESGKTKELFEGYVAQYLPTGHLVYTLGNNIADAGVHNLFAVPFDLNKLEPTGSPVSLVENINGTGGMQYAISKTGALAYIPAVTSEGASTAQQTLVWVDKNGKEEPIPIEITGPYSPRISPDGTRLALSISKNGNLDIYIWDLARETSTRLTFNDGDDRWPLWTPDGKRIVFSSAREGELGAIYSKTADGSGEAQKLASWSNISGPFAWTKDGKTLLSWDLSLAPLHTCIAMLQLDGDNTRKPLLEGKFNYDHPQISPDGRWLAYATNESGQNEVFVCSYPDVNKGKWQISADGGYGPLWSPDGREIFYRNGESGMAVSVETEPVFKPGKSRVLFQGSYYHGTAGPALLPSWDIDPAGKRFLMTKPAAASDGESPTESLRKINIVLNWFEELKQRVPTD